MSTRVVSARLWIDWDYNGEYTNESQYLMSASGDMRMAAPGSGLTGSSGIVATATFTLHNTNGRFSPLRSDGPLYSLIRDGQGYHAPCYFEVSINGGSNYYRTFTGILKLPSEDTLTADALQLITLEARSLEEKHLQTRYSSPQAGIATRHEAAYTEADYIYDWLTAAGVAAGDMILDDGLFVIPWSWLDDESIIEDCWQMAAACAGRLYCDPDGKYRYENMGHWQTASRSLTSQATLARGQYNGLTLAYDDSNLFNVVTVEAAPRSRGAVDVVWEPDTTPVIAPASTTMLTARFDAPLYSVVGIQFKAVDDAGNDRTSDVSISPTYYAQRADLQIVNAGGFRVHLYPCRIIGAPVIGGPEIEESRNSTAHGRNASFFVGRGTRTKSVRGNAYIQTQAHAATMAQMLLDQSEIPRLSVTVSQADGDPALRLGDRITVQDTPTITGSLAMLVTGINWTYSTKFRQNLEGVDVSQLYRHDGLYFILATHTIGSARRLFY